MPGVRSFKTYIYPYVHIRRTAETSNGPHDLRIRSHFLQTVKQGSFQNFPFVFGGVEKLAFHGFDSGDLGLGLGLGLGGVDLGREREFGELNLNAVEVVFE